MELTRGESKNPKLIRKVKGDKNFRLKETKYETKQNWLISRIQINMQRSLESREETVCYTPRLSICQDYPVTWIDSLCRKFLQKHPSVDKDSDELELSRCSWFQLVLFGMPQQGNRTLQNTSVLWMWDIMLVYDSKCQEMGKYFCTMLSLCC